MRCLLLSLFLLFVLTPPSNAATSSSTTVDEELLSQVVSMKDSARGPFSRIRWFCADGTVLPPTPYACKPHGPDR
jgi:hypothetical protein